LDVRAQADGAVHTRRHTIELVATIKANAVPTAVTQIIGGMLPEIIPRCLSATYTRLETVRVGGDPEMVIV